MADMSQDVITPLKQKEEVANYQNTKKMVLNYLFRHICFVDEQNKIKEVTKKELDRISTHTKLSNLTITTLLNQFFEKARNFKIFFASKPITWEYNKAKLEKKVRIYLHKLYRTAPIFSYSRAKANLRILHALLEQKNHWPHITTQMALVIFVTDRNNLKNDKGHYIIQKNLRAFCDCSAYAFHRARNILRINTKGQNY